MEFSELKSGEPSGPSKAYLHSGCRLTLALRARQVVNNAGRAFTLPQGFHIKRRYSTALENIFAPPDLLEQALEGIDPTAAEAAGYSGILPDAQAPRVSLSTSSKED